MKKSINLLLASLLITIVYLEVNINDVKSAENTQGNSEIAFLREKNIWVFNSNTNNEKQITKSNDIAKLYGWTKGKKIVYGKGVPKRDPGGYISGYNLWMFNPANGEEKQLTSDSKVTYASCSLLNENIIYIDLEYDLWEINSINFIKRLLFKNITSPLWSPDGKKFSFKKYPDYIERGMLTELDNIGVFDYEKNEWTILTDSKESGNNEIGPWLSDGEHLLLIPDSKDIKDKKYNISVWWITDYKKREKKVYEPFTKLLPDKPYPYRNKEVSISFSPNGENILFSLIDKPGIWVLNLKNSEIKKIKEKSEDAQWISVGKKIIFIRDDRNIWIVDKDGNNQKLLISNGYSPFIAE